MERRTYHFDGHVQGVGFRYTARHLALGRPLKGYVRNLPDGQVEMVVEGEPTDIEALVESIRRQMEDFIRDVRYSAGPPTGEFKDFSIRP